MENTQRPFSHNCHQVVVNCPKCGDLHVDVNIVSSILLRRRDQIEAFILAGHNRSEHPEESTSAAKRS